MEQGLAGGLGAIEGKVESTQVEALFSIQQASMRIIKGLDGNKERMRQCRAVRGLFEIEAVWKV